MAAHPLFLELAFESFARPTDIGEGVDPRRISVGFKAIVARDAAGQESARVDFSRPDAVGADLLCGIDRGEAWGGAWNDGDACILLTATKPIRTLEIDHDVYVRNGPRIPTRLRCNGVDLGRMYFEGGCARIDVPASADATDARCNVSLAPDALPDVSVLILNFNRPDLTRKAVLSVLAGLERCSAEIIVVDNGSDALRFAELQAMQLPVRLIRFEKNCGFAEGNHHAAELARGRHLLLMNNDLFVTHGVIDRLHDVLTQDREVGAVGPVFRFPDGKLQEAGGVVTAAGEAYQRGVRDPNLALEQLPLLEDVGYLSAACLMLRARDFIAFGGFDPAFEPAYYEDTDLCQRLRARGKRIVLARKAMVFHVMNATTRDPAARIAIDEVGWCNRLRFASRWGDPKAERNPAMRPLIAPPQLSLLEKGPRFEIDLPRRLDGAAQDAPILCMARALAEIGGVALRSDPPSSQMRLRFVAARMQIPAPMFAAQGDHADDSVLRIVSTCDALPDVSRKPGRLILHCAYPTSRAKFDDASLQRFERVVVDSGCARRALLARWREAGITPRPITVLRPPVAAPVAPASAKENLIVCRATFSTLHVAHDVVLDAFAALRATPAGKQWQLVVCGDLAGTQGGAVFERITERALSVGARALLEPPPDVWSDLLARAKVFVSADGLGFRADDAELRSSLCVRDALQAVAAQCVPLVHDAGPVAEMCAALDTGVRFPDADAFAAALSRALTTEAPAPERLQRWSWRAYSDRVKAIVDGTPLDDAQDALPPPPALGARRAFVVIGCHRSGTSAMARTLSLAGASLPRRMMDPKPDNPTGFWEPREISALNDRILETAGSRWDAVEAAARARRIDLLDVAFVPQAREQLRADYGSADAIVLKDPRISLLVPLWDGALVREGFRPLYVIMVRSPFEVAESLHRRNGLDREQGLLLWASHLLRAEQSTRRLDRVFVSFEDLLADAGAVMDRLEAAFGLALSDRASSLLEISRFLDAQLRHSATGSGSAPLQRAFLDLHQAALDACRNAALDAAAWSRAAAPLIDRIFAAT